MNQQSKVEQWMRDAAREICRELYDRYMMGGWDVQDPAPYVEDYIASHASTPAPTPTDIENLRIYAEAMAGLHADDCPADDTCDCYGKAINDSVNRLCNWVASAPTPAPTPCMNCGQNAAKHVCPPEFQSKIASDLPSRFEASAPTPAEGTQHELKEFKKAANLLIDYCEDHNWGTMPEPYDSINPLLKLLNRKCECTNDGKGHLLQCNYCRGRNRALPSPPSQESSGAGSQETR